MLVILSISIRTPLNIINMGTAALLQIICWLINEWYKYLLKSFQVCIRVTQRNKHSVRCWKRWNQNWKCHTLHRKTAGIFFRYLTKLKTSRLQQWKDVNFVEDVNVCNFLTNGETLYCRDVSHWYRPLQERANISPKSLNNQHVRIQIR